MTQIYKFYAAGRPITQGSKKGFAIRKGGRLTGAVSVVDVNKEKLKVWRPIVAYAFMEKYGRNVNLHTGPVRMEVVFHLRRPKAHYRTGKYSHLLKPNAPEHHIQAPDSLKMMRAVEDALKGVIYFDDSQANEHAVKKIWVGKDKSEGAWIKLTLGVIE